MYLVIFLLGALVGAALLALLRQRRRGEPQSPGYAPLPSLPPSMNELNGWVDYDRPLLGPLTPVERIAYLEFRVHKVVIRPLRVVVDDLIHMPNKASALLVFGVAVCSAIEATGKFVKGDDAPGGAGDNKARFRKFVDDYMDSELQQMHRGDKYADITWKFFRNGLAHGFTVSHGGFEGSRGDPYTSIKSGHLVVNPYRFFEDFCQGFGRYLTELKAAQPVGQLYTNFDKVFTAVFIQGR